MANMRPAGNASDEALLAAFVERRDREALSQLVRRYQGRVYNVAMGILSRPAEAEDAAQDAFVQLVRRAGTYAPERGAFRPWMLRLAARAAMSQARSNRAHAQRGKRAAVRSAPENESAGGRELSHALRAAVEGLPVELRAPVVLRYWQDLTQREVAEALGEKEGTIAARLSRAREKLRERLARVGALAVSLPAAGLASALSSAPVYEVPASLAARLGALAGGAKLGGGKVFTAAAAASKGGIAMKMVAGVVLAGAVAAGVAVSVPRGATEPLAAAGGGKEVYTAEVVVGQFTPGTSCGPGRIAQGSISTDRIYSAKRKRLYWFAAEGGKGATGVGLTSWDPATGLKEMVAGGGGIGDLDGPREVWRGATWHYQTSGIGLDDEKDVLYVLSSSKVKAISLEDGSLRTVADPGKLRGLCVASDGMIYTAGWGGVHRVDPASGKSSKVNTEPFPGKNAQPWGYMAADPARGKLYGHGRGNVYSLDLKTGKFTMLCGGGKKWCASPFKDAAWYCPSGATMTLDGRYLIVGGGDQQTYLRLDLDKQRRDMLVRTGKGADARWSWGDTGNRKDPGIFPWPGTVAADANTGDLYYGNSVWPFGLRLKRVK